MRVNISKKIMGMVIIPIMFICVVVGVISANVMRDNIVEEIERQLKVGAYGISQTLEIRTLKDEINEVIYDLFECTDMDVTVFYGDERIASTIDGVVGTKMDSNILNEIKSGKDYFAADANVNGQSYFGYYIPFFTDGQFSGATFTGIPQEEASRTITLGIVKIVGCIVACGLIAVVIAIFMVRGIVKNINYLQNTIGTLLDNNLSIKHEKYDFENDEILIHWNF